jgi:acyl-CoA synthetase (AMP-forming)/AMP-acid ligase II
MSQVVQTAADTYGGKIAIQDGETIMTYTQLNEARWQVAAAFYAAGVHKGDRIAIWAPNKYQWILAAIGAQTLGIVLVPINTRWKGSEAAFALNMSCARMLFTVGDFLGQNYAELLVDQTLPYLETTVMFDGNALGSISWQEFLDAGAAADTAELHWMAGKVTPDDPLDISFTSGTTGSPKGVVTGHGQNIRVFETWSATVGLRSDDNYLIISPFFHAFGYKAGWLAAIIRGAKILPALTFDLDAVLAQIERDKITMLPGAPTIYQSILAHPRRHEFDLSSLRLAVTGAAPVPVELVNKMRNELQFEVVVTGYGLTETCGTVTICDPDDPAEVISGTSGKPMDGVEVQIVSKAGEELPRGEPGEIWVRGYNVMQSYLDDPVETDRTITSQGWMRTGDVGVMDESGYIRITDRIKDMFIVGGFNCYPAEIENILCSLDGVAQAAVIGVTDERMGEVASAWLILSPGARLDEASVIDWCSDNMANYKVPRRVHLVDSLPTNASGKVLKTELKKMESGQ